MVQAHVFYAGTVQGVGFRYTVRQVAYDLGLNGWVRNLADGRVEMVVVGPQETVEGLLEKIESHFEGYIRDRKISYEATEGTLKDFRIVF